MKNAFVTALKKPGSAAVASAPWQADLRETRREEQTLGYIGFVQGVESSVGV